MNEQKIGNGQIPTAKYRPSLAFYHANAKGTGGAMRLRICFATGTEEGCVMAEAANQLTVGNRLGATPVYPIFDWENKIVVKLGFSDICRMLQVFRGECETLGDGEKGLYHQTKEFTTRIDLRHLIEPISGYSFELYRTSKDGSEQRTHFVLSSNEALGVCVAIESMMGFICFGVPRERDHGEAA